MLMMDHHYEVKHLLYQNSGDIDDHDHSRVVGYHAFAILRGEKKAFSLSDEEKQMLKKIAYESIKDSLDGKEYQGGKVPEILQQRCGAFVSLHKHGQLRGCIGHFGEDTPLHEMVAEMARAAAFEDPRFMPVTRDELDDLDIEISVLTPMRRIHSLDEFELHRHGIYIRKGYRSGTFLPQVADEVNWTKEEFVGHCSQDKAGLGWEGWRDAELFVYEAIVF
jgi:AmmeMemoRadiSam system protein A